MDSKIPLSFPEFLSFECVADQIIWLAVPEGFEIVDTEMPVEGRGFSGNGFGKSFGTTVSAKTSDSDGFTQIDQSTAMPLADVKALIIDFHTQRTLTGLSLNQMQFPTSLNDGFCVLRVWGGGSWYLPAPKNLFGLGTIDVDGGTSSITEGVPEITAEKLFLTFARLKRSNGTYVQHNQTNGNLNALGVIRVEEQALTSSGEVYVFTTDFLTNFFIQIADPPPLLQPEDEFFTFDQVYALPDFSDKINSYTIDADPHRFEDMSLLNEHPEFDYMKDNPFFLIPIRIHTDMSGELVIHGLNLDYAIHHKSFRLEGQTEFTHDEKTLSFEFDEQRAGAVIRKLQIDLKNLGSIDLVSMKLEGSLSHVRIVPSEEIRPAISADVESNTGFQITENKSAAQSISFLKPCRIKGVDIRVRFLDKKVGYTVEVRRDRDNQPGDEAFASKEMEYTSQSVDEDLPQRDFEWIGVEFDQEVEIAEGAYWIVLKSREGEIVWQLGEPECGGSARFLYTRESEAENWIPLSRSCGCEVDGIFRIQHIPSSFSDPPSLEIRLNGSRVWELAQDPQTVEVFIEEQVNTSDFAENSQVVDLLFEARSAGEIKISDLLVKYRENESKRVQISGWIESQCPG